MNPTLKKFAVLAAKIGVSSAILGYLFYNAANTEGFKDHIFGQKDWLRLVLALLAVLAAVTLTVFRWQLLARTLGLAFSTAEALRVGFLGYAVNLLPLGLVGGDAVKAVYLARLHPTRKTEAVATVFVDRAVGLVALLVLAAVGTLLIDADGLGIADQSRRQLLLLCRGIQVAAAICAAGTLLLFVPGLTTSPLWNQLARIPVVGDIIRKLVTAMHVYRGRVDRLLLALGMSLGVHLLYVFMIYLIGGALLDESGQPTPQPRPLDHGVFVPVAMAAGTLPLGFFEWLLTLFYEAFSPRATDNKGLLVALVYRVIQALVAAIGMAPFILSGKANPVIHAHELLDKDLPSRKDAAVS